MSTRVLLLVLLRRELTPAWLGVMLLMAVAAAWAALDPFDASADDVMSRVVRRADLALLALTAVLAAAQVTQRVTCDRNLRWLEPCVAAGTDSRRFIVCIIAVTAATRWAWLAAAAGAFAFAAWVRTGSAELALALPALLLGAAALVTCITAFAALFALLVHDAIAALSLALLAGAAPLIVASIHELRAGTGAPPWPVRAWVMCCTPPLQLPDSLRDVVVDSLWLLALLFIAALLSHRVIGRHA